MTHAYRSPCTGMNALQKCMQTKMFGILSACFLRRLSLERRHNILSALVFVVERELQRLAGSEYDPSLLKRYNRISTGDRTESLQMCGFIFLMSVKKKKENTHSSK